MIDFYFKQKVSGNGISIKLPFPTNSSVTLSKYARIGFNKVIIPGLEYKQGFVGVEKLCEQDNIQGNVFMDFNNAKHNRLMEAMDKLDDRYGRGTVKLVSQGDGQAWKNKMNHLSVKVSTQSYILYCQMKFDLKIHFFLSNTLPKALRGCLKEKNVVRLAETYFECL